MEIINTNFDQFNSQQIALQQRKRFHLPMSEDELIKPLTLAYAACVRERGCEIEINDTVTERIKKVARWLTLQHGRTGLLLYGTVGTGKTTMLQAVCRLINYVVKPEYGEQTLNNDYREVINIVRSKDIVESYQNDRKFFDKMCRLDLLAIDEFGVEAIDVKSFGNSNEPIIDLLSTRYDRQRVTLISSNLDLDEIRNRYGLRLQDRFVEMFNMVAFTGETFRK